MKTIRAFKRIGTIENIVIRTGVLAVDETPDFDELTGTAALAPLFDRPPPTVEEVAPLLVKLVQSMIYEASEVLSGVDERLEAVAGLRALGMTNDGFFDFATKVKSVLPEVKKELAAQQRMRS